MNINSISGSSSNDSNNYYNRITGLASGLDTESIIKGLMSAEKAKVNKLYQQKQLFEWKRSDYLNIASEVASFRDYIFNLKLSSNFVKYVSSGDAIASSYISVSGSTNVLEGTYQVKVNQLSENANIFLSGLKTKFNNEIKNNLPRDITITIEKTTNGSTTSKDILISLDANTTEDNFGTKVASAISSVLKADNVSVYYEKSVDKLVVFTKETGSQVSLKITGANLIADTSLNEVSDSGQDAIINLIDKFGNEYSNITSSTNTFSIFGMVITANKTTNGSYYSFSISKDVDSIVNNIKEFINKYNDLVEKVYSKYTEKRNRDYLPLTDDQKKQMSEDEITKWEEVAKKGLLNNDSILSSFLYDIKKALYEPIKGLSGSLNQLSQLGIESYSYFTSKSGQIYIKDENKLREAISNNLEDVLKIFTNGTTSTDRSEQGIFNRLYSITKTTVENIYTKAGKPYTLTLYDNSEIGKQLKIINQSITNEEDRLNRVEERYYQQFTRLETLISQMNNQSSWLAQQFS